MTNQFTDVILVEDNANDAELTLMALRKSGLKVNVKVLRDGADAVDYLLKEESELESKISALKLILIDLKMPKMSGFEVLSILRGHREFSGIPIVVLTSSNVERDIENAYQLGANSYIVKPIVYTQHAKEISEVVRYWTTINKTPRL